MSDANNHLLLADQLCFAVYSTAHALNRVYKPILDKLGLTYPQYLVMLVLWERSGQTVGEIGERLMLESSTLTPLIKRMEQAGLLTRQRDAKDERKVQVHLTDKGRDLRDQATSVPPQILAASGTTPVQLGKLKAELQDIRAALIGVTE